MLLAQHIELFSPYPPEECAARLAADSDKEQLLSWVAGAKPVTSQIKMPTVQLRKQIHYRNSFQVSLTATLQAEQHGTRLTGDFAPPVAVLIFGLVWILMFLNFGLGSLLFSVIDAVNHSRSPDGFGLVVVGVMTLITAAFWLIGRALATSDIDFLTAWLVRVLQATPVSRRLP